LRGSSCWRAFYIGIEKPGTATHPELDAGESGFSGEATTNVKFSEPGEYMLQITVNDYSGVGGAGFQCCWTTAIVKVSVTP
jgi:hypothetical protein